jgi:choline dehydrogenase
MNSPTQGPSGNKPRRFDGYYDFILFGAGSSGSVVAGRLAANPEARILLIEAGGTDQVPEVMMPGSGR